MTIYVGDQSDFEAANLVFAPGDGAYSKNTGILKLGDGFTHYVDLPEVSKTPLGNLASGQVISVTWTGTSWTYGGSVVTARPSNRTDITVLFIDNIGTGTAPAFSQSGDIFIQKTG